jgi:nitrite reductase (NO-forming)
LSTPSSTTIEDAPVDGACCDACAAADPVSAGSTVTPATRERLPVVMPAQLDLVAGALRRPPLSRTADRQVTVVGLAVSAGFLASAIVAMALSGSIRLGQWLPVHLVLAGAAGTAIASVLPFFVAALSAARPMSWAVRALAIALVAGGASAASLGVAGDAPSVALVGAFSYLAGLGGVAVVAFWPLRGAFGPRRRLVLAAYGAGLTQVALGVGIVSVMLAGMPMAVDSWHLLKPAHAWLNVFGFLSVVVAATLVHLAPTVAGTRIVPRRSAFVALVGLATGAPLIALGFALGDDLVARFGALVESVGAVALVAHAVGVRRDRGVWTTDPEWHRLTSWSLVAAPAWLLMAVAIAAGRVLWLGAVPAAWSLDGLVAPLIIGWVVQVLIGAWSHLLPAIGPGGMAAHARQRTLLARAAVPRLVALNVGVLLVVVNGPLGSSAANLIGILLVAAAILGSLAIFVMALKVGAPAVQPAPTAPTRSGAR